MWLWMSMVLAAPADTGDTADTADSDPYRDTAFLVDTTYQTDDGCGGGAAAALLIGFAATRFVRGGVPAVRRDGCPAGRRPSG